MKRLLSLIVLIGLALPALAALPPLSEEARFERAHEVVVARVLEVKVEKRSVNGGFDRVYTATVEPLRWDKGAAADKPERFDVRFHQTASRPSGWAGPQGQNRVLVEGETVRLFLQDSSGQRTLLSPNGWEAYQL